MKPIKKAMSRNGTYMKDGQEKNRYHRMGTLLQRDDGSVALKIDSLPLEFDGWVSFWELDDAKQQGQQPAKQQEQAPADESDFPF